DRRLGERQAESETADADEERPRREDEEPDSEARPEDEEVESPQDPQRRRDGVDAPFRRSSETEHREAKASAYISGSRVHRRPRLLLRLRELLVRMFQRGDEREFFSGEEVDEGSPSRAHVVDSIREPELFDRGDRVSASDDRKPIRFGDRREQLARADRERLEFEDAGRAIEEDRR